jgi:hypothetical protein
MSRTVPKPSTSAAERMRQLLSRWQQSLELHTSYLSLDDDHYWHVQPWPEHQRPAAWVVRLARQKVAELARSLEEQLARKDTHFAEGLEHMAFLANLVGLQPAGRHIPLADPQNERQEFLAKGKISATGAMRRAALRAQVAEQRAGIEPTREMPAPRLKNGLKGSAPRRAPVPRPHELPALPPEHLEPQATPEAQPDPRTKQVLEDAARLLQWGRKWHELGELISRLAERPSLGDVRRILRTHRAVLQPPESPAVAKR